MKELVENQQNLIYIGRKPLMNYALVAIKMFNYDNVEEIKIRARGLNICKAVDLVEYLKNMYYKDLILKDLNIFSEEVSDEKGNKKTLPSIEITINKGKNAPII